MFKLFAAAVLAAGIYAQIEPHCCHLFSGPDYTGDEYQICLPNNWLGE